MRTNTTKGFTLIELLIVVAIIASSRRSPYRACSVLACRATRRR